MFVSSSPIIIIRFFGPYRRDIIGQSELMTSDVKWCHRQFEDASFSHISLTKVPHSDTISQCEVTTCDVKWCHIQFEDAPSSHIRITQLIEAHQQDTPGQCELTTCDVCGTIGREGGGCDKKMRKNTGSRAVRWGTVSRWRGVNSLPRPFRLPWFKHYEF